MGDKVSVGKFAKVGLAAAAFALALGSGSLLSATAPDAAGTDEAMAEQSRQIFNDWSCGACHVLKDAGGMGHVGPSLDGNTNMTKDYIVNRVTNGQGAMPGFGGQLTDDEIALLADYIAQYSVK